jgi:peroxiredoxin Q/BCP
MFPPFTVAAMFNLSKPSADGPQVGQPAPAFSAKDQSGKTVQLADYAGKSSVVLYFYPKDDTPGCTAQACSLRDGHGALLASGAVVLGVSADDVESHAAFAKKFDLPFPILADEDKAIIKAYGVKMPLIGIAKRVTFLIDKGGLIRHIVTDVNAKAHDRQVLELLKGL